MKAPVLYVHTWGGWLFLLVCYVIGSLLYSVGLRPMIFGKEKPPTVVARPLAARERAALLKARVLLRHVEVPLGVRFDSFVVDSSRDESANHPWRIINVPADSQRVITP